MVEHLPSNERKTPHRLSVAASAGSVTACRHCCGRRRRRCQRGECSTTLNRPCKEHRCACCKVNRQVRVRRPRPPRLSLPPALACLSPSLCCSPPRSAFPYARPLGTKMAWALACLSQTRALLTVCARRACLPTGMASRGVPRSLALVQAVALAVRRVCARRACLPTGIASWGLPRLSSPAGPDVLAAGLVRPVRQARGGGQPHVRALRAVQGRDARGHVPGAPQADRDGVRRGGQQGHGAVPRLQQGGAERVGKGRRRRAQRRSQCICLDASVGLEPMPAPRCLLLPPALALPHAVGSDGQGPALRQVHQHAPAHLLHVRGHQLLLVSASLVHLWFTCTSGSPRSRARQIDSRTDPSVRPRKRALASLFAVALCSRRRKRRVRRAVAAAPLPAATCTTRSSRPRRRASRGPRRRPPAATTTTQRAAWAVAARCRQRVRPPPSPALAPCWVARRRRHGSTHVSLEDVGRQVARGLRRGAYAGHRRARQRQGASVSTCVSGWWRAMAVRRGKEGASGHRASRGHCRAPGRALAVGVELGESW